MEKFREFKLENQEMIFGGWGCLLFTDYCSEDGSCGTDVYDTCLDRIIYTK